MDLNLSEILAVFSDATSTPDLSVDSHVIHMNRLGDGEYSPPRSFIPSLLSSKKEDIAAIDMVKDGIQLRAKSSGATTTERFHLKTVGISDKEELNLGIFKNVIHFETEISGFDNLKIVKLENFLLDKSGIWASLNPLAIIRIRFDGPATLFVKSAAHNPSSIPGIVGKFVGTARTVVESNEELLKSLDSLTDNLKVSVEMELFEQEGLTP